MGSSFQAKFVGPYTVLHQLSDQNYLIATPNHRKRNHLCHVNLLKPYYACVSSQVESGYSSSDPHPALTAGTVMQSAVDGGWSTPDDSMLCGHLKNSEPLRNLDA